MRWVIYLALIAVGFYFGKWLGAMGLVAIYFYFFQRQPQLKTKSYITKPKVTSSSVMWAYDALNLTEDADMVTIKQARKRLLNRYHPDKLGQVSEKEKEVAEERVNYINRAYAAIKQYKGF